MRLVTLGFVFALSLALPAMAQPAQPAPDAFDICAREQDPAARLACFDRQIAARRAPNPAGAAGPSSAAGSTSAASPTSIAPPAAVAAPKAAAAPATDSDVGLDARQVRQLHPERAASGKAVPVSIEGKVVRVIARRPLISAFELDNGQVWEQAETVDGLWVKPQETITIRQGVMGGFLLKSADGHVVRVHRLK